MSRLAFFTPLPPAATGIADYSLDVLSELVADHAVEIFHDQARVERERLPPGCEARPVSEFPERHARAPYALAIYQLGNGPAHAYQYAWLTRVPGLLVLHDLVLHHARARMFLDAPAVRAYAAQPASAERRRAAEAPLAAYRAELAYAYPAQAERLAAAQLGTVGDLLPYAYPLFRIPVEASRATAVHNRFMAEAIRAEVADARVEQVTMPVAPVSVAPEAVRELRTALGLAPEDFVVASFGLLTREKGLATLARAVARAARLQPRLRLLLAGPVPDPAALGALLERHGLAARAVVTGRVPFDTLPAHIEAADLVVHLRYPTARETSAALLRVLAQGRPTVLADLEHLDEIPEDVVVRADVADEEGAVLRAIVALEARPERRRRLGERAAAFVRAEHSGARCRAGYARAIAAALAAPAPRPRAWPAHWPRA